jgi:hypothetical protein
MAHQSTLALWLLASATLMMFLGAMACGTAANSPGNDSGTTASDPVAPLLSMPVPLHQSSK